MWQHPARIDDLVGEPGGHSPRRLEDPVSVNRCLNRLSSWQYVAVMAGLCSLACAVEGVLEVLVVGHLDLASLVRFWCVFTLIFCTGGVVQRRRRNPHVPR
jgi:hypothetical protein